MYIGQCILVDKKRFIFAYIFYLLTQLNKLIFHNHNNYRVKLNTSIYLTYVLKCINYLFMLYILYTFILLTCY